MSHNTVLKTSIRSREALILALEEECPRWKGHIEVHEKPQAMYGYDDELRPTKAEVIIRRNYVGSAANDLGFALQPDGSWSAIISEYDTRQGYNRDWLQSIGRRTAGHEILRQNQVAGRRCERQWIQGTKKQVITVVWE